MSGLLGHRGLLLAGGRWSPAQLPTPPKLWLDDTSSVTNVSGAASQWSDKSGNNFHFTQSGTSASRPAINAGALNGRRTLTFDGTDDFLEAPSGALGMFRNVSSGWCFVVYSATGTSVSDRPIFYAAIGTSTSGRFAVEAGAPAAQNCPFVYGRRLDSDSFGGVGHGVALTGQWVMALGVLDFSGRTASIYVDGGAATTATGLWTGGGSSSNTDSTGMRIGRLTNGNNPFAGSVATVIAGSASIPASGDIDRLFGCYAWRFGLQGNLPPGHPYKNSPP